MNEYQAPGMPGSSQHDPAPRGAQVPLSAMAIASIVLGGIALLTSFLPIINNISFFLALLGAVFGIVGLIATIRRTRRGKVLAIVALAVSIVAMVVVLVTQNAYSKAIDEALSDTDAATPAAAEPAPAAQPEAAPQQAAKYGVTIDECTVGSDYSDAPAIVVTYTFANNTDKATSFMAAISAKAFQNGVELDSAIMTEGIDAQSTINEIKPGATTTVQRAYLLDDQSEVTVECSELISFDDALLAEKTFSIA